MTEFISKSEKKRQFKHTEKVAAELVELSNNDLKAFPGSEELKQEIIATRGQKGGARKRQVKYVAKVMRQEPLDEIYQFLESRKGSQLKTNQMFHEAERLRDAMINEAMDDFDHCRREHISWDMDWQSDEIEAAVRVCPELDESEVRKTVYSFVKTHNKMHYRELFRMIKAAIDQVEVKKKLR